MIPFPRIPRANCARGALCPATGGDGAPQHALDAAGCRCYHVRSRLARRRRGAALVTTDQPSLARAILDIEHELARIAAVRDAAWRSVGPETRALLWLPAAEDAPAADGPGVCLTLDDLARWRASEGGGVFANLPPDLERWERLDAEHRALDRERQRLIAGLSIEEDLLLEDARACRARH